MSFCLFKTGKNKFFIQQQLSTFVPNFNVKKIINILFLFFAFSTVLSQNKKKKDIDAIKSMCGCFEIEFNFAETFALSDDEDYKKSKIYKAK